jgi:hypothetical protein
MKEIFKPGDFDYSVIRTPDDVSTLILNFEARGYAARCLYEQRSILANDVVYRGLIDAWAYDHEGIISEFGELEFVEALRQVSPPSKRSEPIRAWRLEAVYGISWTTDRDIACWFAMRHYEQHQDPFVFFCDLSPDEIIAEQNLRNEYELLVDPKLLVGRAMLDADISIEASEMKDNPVLPPWTIVEWRLGCERYADVKEAEQKARLKTRLEAGRKQKSPAHILVEQAN